jgi:hypothetical protein
MSGAITAAEWRSSRGCGRRPRARDCGRSGASEHARPRVGSGMRSDYAELRGLGTPPVEQRAAC